MAEGSNEAVDVLVVGAGPVGLTAACELRRHGASCRVVDDEAGPTPLHESRALAIWERTLEVFAGVGVVDRVLARGRRVRGGNFYGGGRRLAHVDFQLHDADTPYPFGVALPQGETERALIERLAEHGGAVEWRTRLTGLAQDGSGVSATLALPDGGEATARARWLVGCDGARSAVRHQLGLSFEGAEYEEAFLLADVRITWDRPDDEAQMALLPDGGAVAAFPLPEPGRWRVIDIAAPGEPAHPDDPAAVVARLGSRFRDGGLPDATLSDPVWVSTFRIHRRIADRFRVGRVFVAGDAAHIHSPAGGQGMNTGIQDAHNLAWKLALAARGRAGDRLLDSYQAERRPVAVAVLRGTDLVTRMVTLHGDIPRLLRDRLLGFLGEFDFVRRRAAHALSELDIGYRGSPVVAEDRAGLLSSLLPHGPGPHPGDRAPDVVLPAGPGGGPSSLFDVLARSGVRHTLLLFPGGDPAALAAVAFLVRDRYADLIRPWLVARNDAPPPDPLPGCDLLPDPDASLHRRYGADAPCLYLIRPDGFVGYRAQPPDAARLGDYLGALLA